MSEIVGFVGMSHSPFATMLPPATDDDPGAAFVRDARRVAKAVSELAPDAVVVIGPDHFHANFYDVMPFFTVGVEDVEAFGDYDTFAGRLPIASGLAWAVHTGLVAADFDLTLSYSLTVDHGIVQSYEMATGGLVTPLVPLVINTAAPPLPSLARCEALGRALGTAIREADAGRVLVVASGGLSHWLPSNDPRNPAMPPATRTSIIHGRRDARGFAAAREPRVRAMGGNPTAPVNEAWDEWFLAALASPDLSSIVGLGSADLELAAGTGAHEIRAWLIGHAAVGAPVVWTCYDPVPEWITGMGIATTFPVS